jgi:hypothetical protein
VWNVSPRPSKILHRIYDKSNASINITEKNSLNQCFTFLILMTHYLCWSCFWAVVPRTFRLIYRRFGQPSCPHLCLAEETVMVS